MGADVPMVAVFTREQNGYAPASQVSTERNLAFEAWVSG